jgi:type II secretory pathway pseudopilin PulG
MTSLEVLAAVAVLGIAATVALLVQGLRVWRESARLQREAVEAASRAARSQYDAAEALRAAIESARRTQELAARPVLRFSWEVRGRVPDVGHSPVVFAATVTNVGHGTAVIEQVRILTQGVARVTYSSAEGDGLERLKEELDREVFQRIAGASLEALSAHLTLAPLTDSTRALEVGGRLDIFRVQLYAHQAQLVEYGLEAAAVHVSYRSLAGARFEASEQFADLKDGP